MKLNIKSMLAAGAIATALSATAQNTEAGYFLDDYTYRFQMNPAFGNSRGFVSMPALGNLNVGISGNLGVQDVLYNVNGKTVTFMHPDVSTAEAMKNLGNDKRFAVNLRETILAVGFKGIGGYNTISISARTDVGVKLPSSIFSFLKEGVTNDTYHIANFKARATAFAEVALNHSREIMPGLRVGATLKGLVGAGNARLNLEEADLALGTDDWAIRSRGEMYVNMKGFTYDLDVNDNTGHQYVNGADYDWDGISGIGAAIDLGATWKPQMDIPVLKDFEFSVALLDFGFINWKNQMLASTQGTKTFNVNQYVFNVDDNASNSFDNEWDRIKDDISALYELDDLGDQGSQTSMLGATLNIGALYNFPYYKGLKFGLLNTTYIAGEFTWTDFRLSANLIPCKVVDLAVNVHTGTYGTGFGGILNLHCPGFNLFVAADDVPTKFSKQYVPLTSRANVNFGINFLF